METIVAAIVRETSGRGAARQTRREGRVPAVIYGACEPMRVSCSTREINARLQEESFHSTVLTLEVDGKKIPALLREVQMHPYRREVMHIDFQAVDEEQEIGANVPLHFINAEDAPGVKLHHAIFTTIENQVAIHCLPKALPEFISVDVGALDIGQNIHLSEISPPPGVRFDAITRGDDPALAVMNAPKAAEEEEQTTEEAATESDENT